MLEFFEWPDFGDFAPIITDTAAGFAPGMHVALDPECSEYTVAKGAGNSVRFSVREKSGEAAWAEIGMVLPGEGWASCNRIAIGMTALSIGGCMVRPYLRYEKPEGFEDAAAEKAWDISKEAVGHECQLQPSPLHRQKSNLVRLILSFSPTVFDLEIRDITVAGFR